MEIASLARRVLPLRLRYHLDVLKRARGTAEKECPICDYAGRFRTRGLPPRFDALCPSCGSFERHRLLQLYLRGEGAADIAGRRVLHFAPEACVERIIRGLGPSILTTADLMMDGADERLDIERIDKPDGSFDTVVCLHVLEHVDDRSALGELHRILGPHGVLILMVPIVEGWTRTYECKDVVAPADRDAHFGQSDHLRYYGRDFRSRVTDSGFAVVEEFTAYGPDVVRYGLVRGETVFVARKNGPQVAS